MQGQLCGFFLARDFEVQERDFAREERSRRGLQALGGVGGDVWAGEPGSDPERDSPDEEDESGGDNIGGDARTSPPSGRAAGARGGVNFIEGFVVGKGHGVSDTSL